MKKKKQRFFYFLLCSGGVCIALLGILFGTTVFRAHTGAYATNAKARGMQGMPTGVMPMRPMPRMGTKIGPGSNKSALACLNSPTPPLCYSPQQIRGAYGIQPLLNSAITGKGRIITIIDAFQSPTIRQDLRLFDRLFGLNDPQLNIIAPFGLTPFNPNDANQTGFAGEIALDVEWAHVVAPDATIELVLANVKNESIQGQLTALLQATNFAVQNDIGSVISQSFGASESCLSPALIQRAHQIFQKARAQHQTVFASAGDMGASALQCDGNGQPVALIQGVNYPASDPLVSSVGGTKLLASRAGVYMGETTWNESERGSGATGGGASKVFALPAFQQNIVNSQTRAISDISLDADPLTSVPVVTSSLMPGRTMLIPAGGTSVGAPVAAGMVALFDQEAGGKRLGFLNSAFYRISQNATAYAQAFHDITVGNNTFVFQNGNNNAITIPGFTADTGWDPPTGVGTPNAAHLAQLLPQFINANDGAGL